MHKEREKESEIKRKGKYRGEVEKEIERERESESKLGLWGNDVASLLSRISRGRLLQSKAVNSAELLCVIEHV